ncbi:MAG: sigma-70 family RNA polymerase sigma factor [Prevotella sp.]
MEQLQKQSQSAKESIGTIYEKYAHEMTLYFCGYTYDKSEAEDMTQDLFVKVLELDLVTTDTVKNLLMTIARRMIIDDIRHKIFVKRQMEGINYSIEYIDKVTATEVVNCKQIEQCEQRFLQDMPKQRGMIYRLSRYDQMSVKEIAEQLSLNKRTVESHLYVSRREMREYMQKII